MKNKYSLPIMQIASAVLILFSVIPIFNPFRFETVGNTPLIFMIWNTGKVGSYFAEQSVNAVSLNTTLFAFALIFVIALLFILMTTILSFSQSDIKKRAINIGMFFGLVFTVFMFALFLIYTDLNTQILSSNLGHIHRKMQIITETPVGVYCYFVIAAVYTVAAFLAIDFDINVIRYAIQSRLSNQFKGGIHPPYNKNTRNKLIETIESDKYMVYPLSQHIGAPCKPLVAVGDDVLIGQKIADSDAFVSSPIHATVSGKVVKIEQFEHPIQNECMAIVVENDGADRVHPSLNNVDRDYLKMSPEEIIGYVREGGVVGMGGAAFPTHVKMQSALGKIDSVIINAAECEPYLSSDHRLLLEKTAEFVEGVRIIRYALGVRRVYIGIESNKPDAISKLYKAFRKTGVRIVVLTAKYPQGGEKQLIKAVTGRTVPSGGLPIDAGCCVFNVDTAIAIYRAVVKGYPLMRRIVTLSGNALQRNGNANVRLGTPIGFVLSKFGLREDKLRKLVMGGPMMGNAICHLNAPVIKSTSGLLCFTEQELVEERDDHTCIRCGRCITVCPMRLTPIYLNLYSSNHEFDRCNQLGAMDCIECGCCSYTCPAKLPLLQHIRIAKQKIKEQSKKS